MGRNPRGSDPPGCGLQFGTPGTTWCPEGYQCSTQGCVTLGVDPRRLPRAIRVRTTCGTGPAWNLVFFYKQAATAHEIIESLTSTPRCLVAIRPSDFQCTYTQTYCVLAQAKKYLLSWRDVLVLDRSDQCAMSERRGVVHFFKS